MEESDRAPSLVEQTGKQTQERDQENKMGRGIERGQAMHTARPLQQALRGRDLRQKSFKCELLSRTERGLFAEYSGGPCGWSQGQGDGVGPEIRSTPAVP